jgi:E3 SUMO-protein ligase PIAS1
VEDVIVEPDGQWHTDDNKYGSPEWITAHPPKPEPTKAAPVLPQPQTNDRQAPNQGAIVVLSDDEDDEGRVKRELSPSYDPGTSNSSTHHSTPGAGTQAVCAVIDLTLSDDEDDPPAPVPPKRKPRDSHSPTEPAWKRSRYGEPGTPNAPVTAPPTVSGSDTSSWRTLPPIPANRGVSRTSTGSRHASYYTGSGSYRNPPTTRW